MPGDRSTVRVQFLGDTDSLTRAARTARGEMDKVGKSVGGMKKLVGGLAIAGAGAAAFSFAKGLVADAAESAKVMRLTEAVIKSTGGTANVTAAQISDLATSISNKTGADDEAIQSGQNLLLTFTNVRNQVGKGNDIFNQASQAVTDMTAAMNGGDVSAEKIKGTSIQLGKALNDPVKGITALTRSGVTFTKQQKDQIAQMVKAGDTAGAQKIILAELNKEFGGAAAAASSPAQKASVAWGNLREQLGSYLLPVVSKLATFLSTQVIPAVSKFAENVRSGGGGFAKFRSIIGDVRDFIANQVVPALQRFGQWFQSTGWPAIKRFAAAFIEDLKPAVDAAIHAFQTQLRPALESAIAKFREAWPTIQRVQTILAQIAEFILTKVVPVLIQLYSRYLATIIRVFGELFAAGWKVIGFLIDLGRNVGEAGAAFGRFVGKVAGAMSDAYNAVKRGIGDAVDLIRGLPGKAINALGDLGGKLVSAGEDLVRGMIQGITNGAGWLYDKIKEALVDKPMHLITHPWEILSPSKVTRGYGQNIAEGMALGIQDKAGKVAEQIKAMTDKAKEKLREVKDFARDIRAAFTDTANVTGIDTLRQDAAGNDVEGGFGALLEGLRKKAADAAAFASAMQQLRKSGLNESTLAQLRDAGPGSGLGAAQNLLAGGAGGIGQVNALTRQIAATGGTFAEREAKVKYGIGAGTTLKNATDREIRVILDLRGEDAEQLRRLRKMIRVNGGNVQTVLGAN